MTRAKSRLIAEFNNEYLEIPTGTELPNGLTNPSSLPQKSVENRKKWTDFMPENDQVEKKPASFAQKFHQLTRSPLPGLFDALIDYEKYYTPLISELCEKRQIVLQKLRQKHSRWNMESEEVQTRANQETELVQSMFQAAFQDVNQQQRAKYREFVEHLYEQHQTLVGSLGSSSLDSEAALAIAKKEVAQLIQNDPDIGKRMVQDLAERSNVDVTMPALDFGFIQDPEAIMVQMESMEDLFGEFDSKPTKEDPALGTLKSMGFSTEMSKAALKMTNDNLENAVSLLLEQPNSVEAWIKATSSPPPPPKPVVQPKPVSTSLSKWKESLASSSAAAAASAGQKRIVSNPLKKPEAPPPKPSPKPSPTKQPPKQDPFSLKKLGDILTGGSRPNTPVAQDHAFTEPDESEMWTVGMGSQVRSMYTIRLSSQSLSSLFRPPPDLNQDLACKAQTLGVLYESGLRGIVLVVTPQEWYKMLNSVGGNRIVDNVKPSPSIKALFDTCRKSTEFHFDQFEDQLKAFDRKVDVVKEGDVFVTKHSNLPLIHLVFFLITENSEFSNRSPSLLGLRKLVKTAFDNYVTHLTVPLLLQPELQDTTLADKRAEIVLKATKGALIEIGRGIRDGRQLQFLVPLEQVSQWQTFRDRCAEVFRTGD